LIFVLPIAFAEVLAAAHTIRDFSLAGVLAYQPTQTAKI
jgi:hypothetical protein